MVFSNIVKYGISGSLAALVHLACLFLLVEYCALNKILSSCIGFAFAIIVNYLLQYYWIFSSPLSHTQAFLRYVGVTLSMMMLNAGLFWLGMRLFPIHHLFVQIVVIAVLALCNFFINSRYTFRCRS